jgi:hypothetical protein
VAVEAAVVVSVVPAVVVDQAAVVDLVVSVDLVVLAAALRVPPTTRPSGCSRSWPSRKT